MSRVKFIPLLMFLALSFLVSVPGWYPSSEPLFCQAGSADAEGATTEAQGTVNSPAWCRPIKNIAKRRTDTFAPTITILSLVTHIFDQAPGRFGNSSAAVTYQAAPLYQSLQVYRL